MSVVGRSTRAFLVFAGASILTLVVTAQLAPGWRAADEQPALRPERAAANTGVGVPADRPIVRLSTVVRHADGRSARAWIVKPLGDAGAAQVPGVVLVHGSGPADRDALLSTAEVLARAGVAAIVYDKSDEGYSFVSRDYGRLAADAIDAADLLADHPAVDRARVGILGFSEGGWVAPIAAELDPERFAFLILVSATVVSPLDQVAWAADRPLAGAPDWLRRIPATALASGRAFLDYLDTDITPALRSLTVPVYAVWGADDVTMPVTVAARTLTGHIDGPVTARILPEAGHDPGTGAWLSDAAAWVLGLPETARDETTGADPASRLGLATLPVPAWYLNPVAHAALAVALAVASWFIPLRRRHRHPAGDPR